MSVAGGSFVSSSSPSLPVFRPPKWVKDSDAPSCMRCSDTFPLFTFNKHHCRCCGFVVCAKCSNHRRILPFLGKLAPVRVCAHCVTLVDQHFDQKVLAAAEAMEETGSTITDLSGYGESDIPAHGMLVVVVMEARLKLPESRQTPNPFVVLALGHEEKRTTVKKFSIEPSWNEKFIFNVSSEDRIRIDLFDDVSGEHALIGHAQVPLFPLLDERTHHSWFNLSSPGGEHTGRLRLKCFLCSSDVSQAELMRRLAEDALSDRAVGCYSLLLHSEHLFHSLSAVLKAVRLLLSWDWPAFSFFFLCLFVLSFSYPTLCILVWHLLACVLFAFIFAFHQLHQYDERKKQASPLHSSVSSLVQSPLLTSAASPTLTFESEKRHPGWESLISVFFDEMSAEQSDLFLSGLRFFVKRAARLLNVLQPTSIEQLQVILCIIAFSLLLHLLLPSRFLLMMWLSVPFIVQTPIAKAPVRSLLNHVSLWSNPSSSKPHHE